MKSQINIKSAKEIYSIWDDTLCFNELMPTSKVMSILEVFEKTKLAALSSQYDYLAVISNTEAEKEVLVIIFLKEKRVEAFKYFPYRVCVIYFIPNSENVLLVGSSCGRIFYFNIENKTSLILEGHKNPPLHISHRPKSDLLITWNDTEVLLWSWPDSLLTRRLKIDASNHVIEAGDILEKSSIFAAFDSGVVLLWDRERNMKEHAIEPPDGITMEFKSFSLSMDGEWIIGVGSQSFVVIYSLASLRVVQTVHLASLEALLGVENVQFLPYIHPQFPKTYLLQTSSCLIIIDFVNSSIIKVLRSLRESICGVYVSSNGFMLAVVYANGITKLYTLPSFFPKPVSALKSSEKNVPVGFGILKSEVEVEIETKKHPSVGAICHHLVQKFLFDPTKWKDILEEFEEFPDRYRKHIWISLLKLPQNFSILNDILVKEKKHKFESLINEFSHLSSTTTEILKSTLECLCYWSPFLAEAEFLPHFILPFVEVFESNLLICFEATVTIILNWCKFWFRNWPNPPEVIMNILDQLLCERDAELWVHLKKIGVSAENNAWPILTSGFRMVFTKKEWLVIWDHILSQPPSFMMCVCASYILSLRQTLLKCLQESHVKELFCQETWVPVRSIIKRAKQLHLSLTLNEDIKEEMETLRFLPKDGLLAFDIIPEKSLSWQDFRNDYCVTPHSVMDSKSVWGSKLTKLKEPKEPTLNIDSPKRQNNRSGSKKKSVTFPTNVAVMDPEQFDQLEEACLRNIQHTRKKLINRTNLKNKD